MVLKKTPITEKSGRHFCPRGTPTHFLRWAVTVWIILSVFSAVGVVFFLGNLSSATACATLCAIALILYTPSLLRRFEGKLFYALIATCPLEMGKSWFYEPFDSSGVGHELRLTIPVLLLLVLGAILAMKTVTRTRVIRIFPNTTIPALLFLLVSAVSCAIAPNLGLAIFEAIRMTEAFLIYFIVANFVVSERANAKSVMTVIAVVLLIQSAVAILQQLTGAMPALSMLGETKLPSEWGEQELFRAGGLMGHPNSLAALLLMLGPITIFVALFINDLRLRCLAIVAAGASTWALLITYSRAAWVAAPAGLLLAAPSALKLFHQSSPLNKRRVIALGGAIVFLSIVAVTVNINSIKERLDQSDDGSVHSRIDMMIDSIEVIKDNYLIGVGLNNYSVVVPRYDVTGIHREWHATDVHNIFLLFAAETGIVSLVFFLVMICRLLSSAARALAVCQHGSIVILLAGMRLAIVCFLIVSMTDPSYRFYPGIERTFWLLMGLVAGYSEVLRVPTQTPLRRQQGILVETAETLVRYPARPLVR